MSRGNWTILVLLVIIFVLAAVIILREPTPVVESFDEGPLREQIRLADSTAQYWQSVAIEALDSVNILEDAKIDIRYEYIEIYRDLPNASTSELDSILRANW